MAITNGFDTAQVMAKLFGRIQWRALNPGGSYPLNYSVNATRPDLFLIAGTTPGVTVGQSIYADSSLIGWSYTLFEQGYGPLDPNTDYTLNSNGFTLTNETFQTSQKLTLQFKPSVAVSPGTTAGRFYEQFHPLCTLDNFLAAQPNTAFTGINDPNFLTLLSDLEQGVIMQLLNGVFNEPQLIESTLMFDRQLRNDIPYTPAGKFCGYRFYIAPGEFAAQISRASFIFNGVATFNLYLFQDMQTEPLFTQSITTVSGQEVLVDLDDWIIHYTQPSSQGGVFYLGYFQNDLPDNVLALDQFINRWNESLAFGYTAFETPSVSATDFIRIQVPYTYRTYGMNLEIQTYKDFTNRVVKNASLFDEAIGLMMAVIVLGYEAYSTRTNLTERITGPMADRIYAEINNAGYNTENNPFIAGLKKQVERETKRINDNFFKKPGVITSRPPIWGDNQGLQGVFP